MELKVNTDLARKFKQLTEAESVKNVATWMGSHQVEPHPTHVLNAAGTMFEARILRYPHSLLQVFMEQAANILDHHNEYPTKVDTFRFTFDKTTGLVSVMNNGPSIPVDGVPDKTGTTRWLPELLATGFLASGNHDKSSGAKRTSIGMNGIGLKGTTAMSVKITLECADTERSLYYKQDIFDCNKKIDTPTIVKLDKNTPAELRKGGTRITYMLDYAFYKDMPADIFAIMDSIFRAKVCHVAGYSGVSTYYNGELVPVKNAKQLAAMYFAEPAMIELTHQVESWPLSVAIGPPMPQPDGSLKAERISIINGGYIPGGVHFDYVIDHMAEELRPKIERAFKELTWRKTLVSNNLSVMIVGTLPDLVMDAQIKNNLKMKNHTQYFAAFTWPKTYLTKVWPIVEHQLGGQFISKSRAQAKTKRKILNPEKYTPAHNLGTQDTDLLAFEGDSAQSSAVTAMADTWAKRLFNHDRLGFFLLGGVPPNASKHMTETKVNGQIISKPDKMLRENIVWNDFMTAMGLEYGKKYDTLAARSSLNYHRFTLVVDKDLHGMGKIAAIMVSNICLFWPELLAVPGFLGYMDSPLIRVFPTNPKRDSVREFRSQEEFDTWRTATFANGIVNESQWEPKWYKGLATHSDEECVHMFGNYDRNRMAYSDEDKQGLLKLAAYFGRETSARKELLSTPPVKIPWVEDRRALDVSAFCDYNVKEEQLYNMVCKLNHIIDNFISSHRKIAWGAMQYMHGKDNNKPIKVYQLAGEIAKATAYHHGNDSINNAIVWLAQDYVGARNIPLLLPLNQFGTRFSNEDDGAPRYIDTKANPIIDAIYPREDRDLYNLMIEDGVPTTPVHMVPVVCMPILETNSLPGTGWAISKWARDYFQHVDNIKRMMIGLMPLRMKPWAPGWKGEVVEINGVEWSAGRVSFDRATHTVTITELPYGVKVKPYIFGKKKKRTAGEDEDEGKKQTRLYDKELVDRKSIRNTSSKLQICISFKLKRKGDKIGTAQDADEGADGEPKSKAKKATLTEDAIDIIERECGSQYFEPLVEYLGLKNHMGAMLNFINDEGTIESFATYEGAMIPWFRERMRLYPIRIARQIMIIDLKIEMIRNRLRYIEERKGLGISGAKRARQVEILEEAKYGRFDTARLSRPIVPNDQVRDVVCGSAGKADYRYLLEMSDADSSEENVIKMREKIAKLMTERDRLDKPDAMLRIWCEEIDKVTEYVQAGLTNGWVPKGKYTYARPT
jgi:DNA topoisomerase-2